MSYLLDTCLISELIKPLPLQPVVDWVKNCDEHSLFLSVLTFGEIQKGIAKLSESKKRRQLQSWLDNDLRRRFGGRILDVTDEIAGIWGKIQGAAERKGKKIGAIDSLIAATALANNLTVVTRNVMDFQESGVDLFNPWP